jgi:hypothetical protein
LRELQSLQFIGTRIEDGNLGPLMSLPKLDDVLFENNRRYTHELEESKSRGKSPAEETREREIAAHIRSLFGRQTPPEGN